MIFEVLIVTSNMDSFIIDEYKSHITDNSHNISFEVRQAVSRGILQKYPNRVPVIIRKSKNERLFMSKKSAFLVPVDMTLGRFIVEVRKCIPNLNPYVSLFFFIDNKLPSVSGLMSDIYEKYKNPDGVLYITYVSENTFG